MGKSTIDNLKKLDVQFIIKSVMDRRRDQIRRLFGYDPKTESYAIIGAIPIVASIAFFMCYFLLALYDTTANIILVALKWTVMIGIYTGLVFYIHSLTFKNVNLYNVVYSLIPIVVLKILLWRWPDVSSPFDNTLGVLYNRYFGPLSRLLQHVNYEPLQGAPFDKISFPFEKTPLDWLFNSFNKDNIDDFLGENPAQSENKTEPNSEIKNIYIQTTVDSENYDVYGYDDVNSDLHELVKWKRYIGHMTYDYIAFILGLTYSMVLSVPS